MIKYQTMLGWGLSVALFFGCATPITVESESNPWVNFSALKTYRWSEAPGIAPDLDKEIRSEMDAKFAEKGYKPVSTGTPDFIVAYNVLREPKEETLVLPSSEKEAPETYTRTFTAGALIVELLSPQQKTIYWKAAAEEEIRRPMPPAVRARAVKVAVDKIFSRFPK